MEHFLIKYYKKKEHYDSDSYYILGDKFYSEEAYINKAQDLMYRFLFYKIEIYKHTNLHNPIRTFSLDDFDRKQYKETNYKY